MNITINNKDYTINDNFKTVLKAREYIRESDKKPELLEKAITALIGANGAKAMESMSFAEYLECAANIFAKAVGESTEGGFRTSV